MNYPMNPQQSLHRNESRVLAIDPSSRGFGYVVLEGPTSLIDWGIKVVRSANNKRCLDLIDALMDFYRPLVLVAEDCTVKTSRRCRRVRKLIEHARDRAGACGIKSAVWSREAVRKAFSPCGATTKHQIAGTVSGWLSELKPYLPPFRKPWMSEDTRMSIFDAASFALTHFMTAQQTDNGTR